MPVFPFRTPSRLSRRALLAGAAACAASAALPASAQSAALRLRRGGSIHSMLNWPELQPGSRDGFLWPPFSAPKYQIAPALLAAFKRVGLDFIRMTVDPAPFLSTQGERRAELDTILLARCKLIHDAGLSVIVDFHPISQVAAYAPARIIETPQLFTSYVQMIGRTAQTLRALDPARTVLEFFNEPPHGYDSASIARWRRMLGDMHAAARKDNPHIPLVMTGAASGGIRGLLALDAKGFADANLYWSFHYYDPHAFTHQGVITSQDNMRHYRYLSDLPWPVDGSLLVVEQTVRQAILVDKSLTSVQRTQMEGAAAGTVREYYASKAGPQAIAADFAKVSDWAREHGVASDRILLGEFGAAKRNARGNGALNSHRYAWLKAIRSEARATQLRLGAVGHRRRSDGARHAARQRPSRTAGASRARSRRQRLTAAPITFGRHCQPGLAGIELTASGRLV